MGRNAQGQLNHEFSRLGRGEALRDAIRQHPFFLRANGYGDKAYLKVFKEVLRLDGRVPFLTTNLPLLCGGLRQLLCPPAKMLTARDAAEEVAAYKGAATLPR